MSLEEKFSVFSFFNILEGDEFKKNYLELLNNITTEKTNDEKLDEGGPVTKFLKDYFTTGDGTVYVSIDINNPITPYSFAPSAPPAEMAKGDDSSNDAIGWIKDNMWVIYISVSGVLILLIIVIIIIISVRKR